MRRILLQRPEEIFPGVRESMNYTNSETVLAGPYGETYPASHDSNQAMHMKAEEVSDAQEEVDSLRITAQEIKAEPEICANSENILVGLHGETYPASHDANQAMNIKAEEVSDAQEEVDPLRITIQEIKAETENCTNSENVLMDPYGERYPTSHDANQAMNVKAKAVSDAEEEEDPVPITFPEIKAEPE
ncbi:uncharacterized protein LOC111861635 isoform X2 [Cryptotermes secundus]|nr:uncharacterized protein LOC111861635 isoform X2 [Cryptotermes secundus]